MSLSAEIASPKDGDTRSRDPVNAQTSAVAAQQLGIQANEGRARNAGSLPPAELNELRNERDAMAGELRALEPRTPSP
jgi:hypothetical protein